MLRFTRNPTTTSREDVRIPAVISLWLRSGLDRASPAREWSAAMNPPRARTVRARAGQPKPSVACRHSVAAVRPSRGGRGPGRLQGGAAGDRRSDGEGSQASRSSRARPAGAARGSRRTDRRKRHEDQPACRSIGASARAEAHRQSQDHRKTMGHPAWPVGSDVCSSAVFRRISPARPTPPRPPLRKGGKGNGERPDSPPLAKGGLGGWSRHDHPPRLSPLRRRGWSLAEAFARTQAARKPRSTRLRPA